MSQGVQSVVREHLKANDEIQEPIEWAEIVARAESRGVIGRATEPPVLDRLAKGTPRPSKSPLSLRRGWVVAAASALVAIVVFGLVPLLFQQSATPPVGQPDRPSWSMAILLPDSAFPIGPRESFDEFVDDAMSWEGVEVQVIESGTEEAWESALGGPVPANICDGGCDPGIALFAFSSAALEIVYRDELFGWWGTPQELVLLSASGSDQLAGRTGERTTYLSDYIGSVAGQRGPEPAFDTSPLGIEQVLVAAPSPEEAEGTLAVAISGTDVTAELSYPRLGDAEPILTADGYMEIALNGSAGHSISQRSSTFADFERITTDPAQGLGVDIVDVIVWEGGIAFGIAGLPATSSVVATELPGGVRLWQTPVSGVAYFTAEGSYSDYIARAGAPPFTAYDSEGNVIHVNH